MEKRAIIYTRLPNGSESEVLAELRSAVEARSDMVVAELADDARITGRGKYGGWRKLLARLHDADQVVVFSAADLPGKGVQDLLKLLATFRGVTLRLHKEGIDTSSPSGLLSIAEAFRRAKKSQSIKAGQAKALAAGKRIGRPKIPRSVVTGIEGCLVAGGGIRPTARRFRVSPASVVGIKFRMANVAAEAEAA